MTEPMGSLAVDSFFTNKHELGRLLLVTLNLFAIPRTFPDSQETSRAFETQILSTPKTIISQQHRLILVLRPRSLPPHYCFHSIKFSAEAGRILFCETRLQYPLGLSRGLPGV